MVVTSGCVACLSACVLFTNVDGLTGGAPGSGRDAGTPADEAGVDALGMHADGSTDAPIGTGTEAAAPSPIRIMTFDDGRLVDPVTGADTEQGGVELESAKPIHGAFSAHLPGKDLTYLQVALPTLTELYVSFYMRSDGNPGNEIRLVNVEGSGTSQASLTFSRDGTLRLGNKDSAIGGASATLTGGEVYRVGLHIKASSTSGAAVMEAFLAGNNVAYGAPFASSSNESTSPTIDRFSIGTTGSNSFRFSATVDDIAFDRAVLPSL